MKQIPVDARQKDWPRLVAKSVNAAFGRITDTLASIEALEAADTALDGRIDALEAADVTLAAADTALDGRVDALEGASTFRFVPMATPSSPVEGLTYMDSTTHKLRTYDGTAWQDHW